MANYERIYKRCDWCIANLRDHSTLGLMWFNSHTMADEEARKQGWYVDAQRDLCPDCRAEYETTEEEE